MKRVKIKFKVSCISLELANLRFRLNLALSNLLTPIKRRSKKESNYTMAITSVRLVSFTIVRERPQLNLRTMVRSLN